MSSDRLGNGKVAGRYAKALFESIVSSSPDELNQVAANLQSIAEALTQVPEFYAFLENPGIPAFEKSSFVEERLAATAHLRVAKLLRLLQENNRLSLLLLIAERFATYVDERDNVAQAEVITAAELDDDLQNRLRHTLESLLGFNRVELQHRVDPGLLGGAIIKIQDRVIDGSYVGRLEELKKQLVKA